jgi:hypothetical protein
MGTTDTSLPPRAPRPRRPRPAPGPPAEVWFWRVLPKKGRGEHRTLADNVQYDGWEHIWIRRPLTPGRYRLEFRDARRAIAGVRYAIVPDPRSGEPPYFTTGRARRPQRTVPPASPAWEPRAQPSTTPTRSAPARSAQGRTSAATAAATHPPLRPPGAAPADTLWRLRQNGAWEPFGRNLEIPKNYHRLWLAISREFVLVYSPAGTWPGYVRGTLKSGEPCLLPQGTRS